MNSMKPAHLFLSIDPPLSTVQCIISVQPEEGPASIDC